MNTSKIATTLETYSHKRLQSMLMSAEKSEFRLKDQLHTIELKIKNTIKKKSAIRNAINKKLAQKSGLKRAIWELENGKTTHYSSVDEMMADLEK